MVGEPSGLEAEEQGLEDAHDGEEEELDDVKAEEEEAEHEVETHALVGSGGVEGEIVHQDLAAVEEGEGQQVEDEEEGVDEDAEVEEEDEGEDAGKAFGADAEVAHGELGGDDERVDGAGDGVADDDEREESDDGGEELGGGAGEGGEHFVAGGVAEVARSEGDGLAPAEDERAAEDEEDGPDEGSEEVEVAGGVHGEAAHHAGGGVAETVGGPGLGTVVKGDGEHHHDEFKDDQSDVQRHEDSLREYFSVPQDGFWGIDYRAMEPTRLPGASLLWQLALRCRRQRRLYIEAETAQAASAFLVAGMRVTRRWGWCRRW